MARYHIHPWAKVGSLKNATVMDLTAELSNMKIENDLRREVQDNIRRLKDMGTYRGRRHAMGLPVRGQRTRTQVGTIVVRRLRYADSIRLIPHEDSIRLKEADRDECNCRVDGGISCTIVCSDDAWTAFTTRLESDLYVYQLR